MGIVKTTSDRIKWYSWDWGVGNELIPMPNFPPLTALILTTNESSTEGRHKIIYSNTAPTTKIWAKGDIVFDTSPTPGGYIGWVCVRSGVAAPKWTVSTSKNVGDKVVPTSDNGYYYECIQAGTTGDAEPTWPTTIGETVTDGTVIWECKGTAALFKGFGNIES